MFIANQNSASDTNALLCEQPFTHVTQPCLSVSKFTKSSCLIQLTVGKYLLRPLSVCSLSSYVDTDCEMEGNWNFLQQNSISIKK